MSRKAAQFTKVLEKLTKTSCAKAILHLQPEDWILDLSDDDSDIEAFCHFAFDCSASGSVESKQLMKSGTSLDESPRIKLVCWNLNGLSLLDEEDVESCDSDSDEKLVDCHHTEAAIAELRKESPDIIFLQEVIPASLEQLEELSDIYELYPAEGGLRYFTAILMKKSTVQVCRMNTKPFESSKQGRKLQIVHAKVKGKKFKLMTSHLESLKDRSEERVRQLGICMSEVESAHKDFNVIFGGDLNIRDYEAKQFNFPDGVVDFWEATGSSKKTKYTWDMLRNDSLETFDEQQWKPRLRFDRIYFKPSVSGNVKPHTFELCGMKRIPDCECFISDHWGLVCHLEA